MYRNKTSGNEKNGNVDEPSKKSLIKDNYVPGHSNFHQVVQSDPVKPPEQTSEESEKKEFIYGSNGHGNL